MSENKNSLIPLLKTRDQISLRNSVTAVNSAIENFRHNSPVVPVEKLYAAYRSLKEMIDSMGSDFDSQSGYLNDQFLRILEERGESESGIYRTVLRDSSEFRFLSGMFIKDGISAPDNTTDSPDREGEPAEETAVKPVLKRILAVKQTALECYNEGEWNMLVEEHFAGIDDEKELVKSGGAVLNRVIKRGDGRDYHILVVVRYLLRRLKSFDKVDISSKEYAMKLMNMVSSEGETWKLLHSDYLDIIRK